VTRPAPWPLSIAQQAAARLAAGLHADAAEAAADHAYSPAARAQLPLAAQRDGRDVTRLLAGAGLEHVRIRPTPEIDRVERGHRSLLARVGDPWRRYVATGRTPIVTAGGS